MRVWIALWFSKLVAPLVGAWIEIDKEFERVMKEAVAPLVGAWIEIFDESSVNCPMCGRSSRGSVD